MSTTSYVTYLFFFGKLSELLESYFKCEES